MQVTVKLVLWEERDPFTCLLCPFGALCETVIANGTDKVREQPHASNLPIDYSENADCGHLTAKEIMNLFNFV